MKNCSFRTFLLVSSIHFALKSEEEQKAVIQGYIQFLNTLDFPLQIIIQSRPFNIKPYLANLDQLQKEHTNELLKKQMADYSDFIKELIGLGEIMSRRFYVVVPYNPLGDKKMGFLSRVSELFSIATAVKIKKDKFEKYRETLFRRADIIISGLSGMGIKAVPLDTQSLIQIFYNIYNPAESEMQKLTKIKDLRI